MLTDDDLRARAADTQPWPMREIALELLDRRRVAVAILRLLESDTPAVELRSRIDELLQYP